MSDQSVNWLLEIKDFLVDMEESFRTDFRILKDIEHKLIFKFNKRTNQDELFTKVKKEKVFGYFW